MKKLLILAACTLIGFISTQCSVQKRHYRGGFYVSKRSHAPKAQQPEVYRLPQSPAQKEAEALRNVVTCAAQQGFLPVVSRRNLEPGADTCDVLLMRNGDEQRVRVLEITQTEIKYRKCDFAGGPLFAVYKKDVFMIRYANGIKEVMEKEIPAAAQSTGQSGALSAGRPAPASPSPKVHNLAALSLMLSVMTIFVPFPFGAIGAGIALALGILGLIYINDMKPRYRGMGFAIAGIIIAVLVIALQVLQNAFWW